MKRIHTKKAFTMVETLVAIAVLMIAIAGPLVVANKGLVAATYSKDQAIATFLAQELMEYIRNKKDIEVYNAGETVGMNNIFFQAYLSICGSDECGIRSDGQVVKCSNSFEECRLYKSGDYGYVNLPVGSGAPTKFKRSIRIKKMMSVPNEVQVTVTVSWTDGARNISLVNQMVGAPI